MTPPLGRCSKDNCLLSQRYDYCPEQFTAKIMFAHDDSNKLQTLHAFGKTVNELVEDDTDITIDVLLKAPPIHSIVYNNKMVITGVTKI